MFIIPPDVESAGHAAGKHARPGATFPGEDSGIELKSVDIAGVSLSPTATCVTGRRTAAMVVSVTAATSVTNGRLCHRTQRSSPNPVVVEISARRRQNRYKPQSLPIHALSWQNFAAGRACHEPREPANFRLPTPFTAASGRLLAPRHHRRQDYALPRPIYRYSRQGLRHGCGPNFRHYRYNGQGFPSFSHATLGWRSVAKLD